MKIRLFGIGLDTYWPQFEGLKERLEGYLSVVEKFLIGARKFVNDWNSHGPAHHCAIGVGHISSKIEKLGKLLNMKVEKVC